MVVLLGVTVERYAVVMVILVLVARTIVVVISAESSLARISRRLNRGG